MFAAAEQAAHVCHRGLNAMERGEPGVSALASAMKALSDDSGKLVSHEAVQLHGGMGVSDELDVGHYLRRLAAIRAELGSADIHRGRFAQTEVDGVESRSEEHTSELQSLMRISYAVFCLKNKQ